MAIGSANERGSLVHVYDENGRPLFTQPAGSGPGDGLKGYTSSTVSIQRGLLVHTYDDRGRPLFSQPTR